MPLSGKPLAEGDIEIIRKWIDAGAKPPTPDEAKELAARLAAPDIPDIKTAKVVKAADRSARLPARWQVAGARNV